LRVRVIVRRLTDYGGAEFIALRFARFLHCQGLLEEVVCGRCDVKVPFRVRELGYWRGGRFLKTYSFQKRVRDYLSGSSRAINFAFSKVPGCEVYVNGGGTHTGFLRSSIKAYPFPRRFFKALSRSLNPVNYYNPVLERQIVATAGRIIAVSRQVKEELLAVFKDLPLEGKIAVVPNPVSSERFNPGRREELRLKAREFVGALEGDFVVGFASSNFWLKGLHLLIEALKFLPESVKLVVAGGRNPEEFLKLARRFGVRERVLFLGKVSQMELFYSGIDLLVHPSYYDTFANVVAEALSMGVPVICSKNTGAREFIEEGVNGFVLKTFSPQEIAEKIKICSGREWSFRLRLPSDREVFQRYLEIGEQSLSRG